MGLTITSTNALSLLHIVNKRSDDLANTMLQLSTGLRINKASDDPAGLIAYELLGADLTAANAALDNAERADAMLSVAEGGLAEVSALLIEIETLVVASASSGGLTSSEIAANQAQIDAAIASIDRIVTTTTFNGKQLLNGSQAIQAVVPTVNTINALNVFTRSQSTSDIEITASVDTTAAVARGTLFTLSESGTLFANTDIEVSGALGSKTINLTAGMNEAAIVAAINNASAETGVTTDISGSGVDLVSTGVGSDQFVEVIVLSGDGNLSGSGSMTSGITRTEGTDAVVTLNGQQVTADGTEVFYSAGGLSLSFSLGTSFDEAGEATVFTVKAAGGLTFQLGTTATTRSTIGISSLSAGHLGGADAGGVLSQLVSSGDFAVSKDKAESVAIVRAAIEDVAVARGRIGGFQKYQVQSSINSLNATAEGLTAARSTIGEVDFAAATAALNKQSVLMEAGIAMLGISNAQGARLLSLLGV
ncbi:MAG: hypothetical protein IID37_03875 [Planctomycetes bacterium]|nr:hypothetical protein [Planctomycetota bacterium]